MRCCGADLRCQVHLVLRKGRMKLLCFILNLHARHTSMSGSTALSRTPQADVSIGSLSPCAGPSSPKRRACCTKAHARCYCPWPPCSTPTQANNMDTDKCFPRYDASKCFDNMHGRASTHAPPHVLRSDDSTSSSVALCILCSIL